MNDDELITTGIIGPLMGWRVGGRSYEADGTPITEVHGPDCFCCGPLFKPKA